MVKGPTHTNLIFDIVVPHQFRLTDDQVVESLRQAVKALDARYEIVVNVDKAYTAPPQAARLKKLFYRSAAFHTPASCREAVFLSRIILR